MVKAIAIGIGKNGPECIAAGSKADVLAAAEAALSGYQKVNLYYFPMVSKKLVNNDWKKSEPEAAEEESTEPAKKRSRKA